MFDIGIGEVAVISVVALLVFGPDRLPSMIRQVGSFIRDIRTTVARARGALPTDLTDLGIRREDLEALSRMREPLTDTRRVLNGIDTSPETHPRQGPASFDTEAT